MARSAVSCLLTPNPCAIHQRINVSCDATSRPQLRADVENSFLGSRQLSHFSASCSERRVPARAEKVTAALFSPPSLDPSKLSLTFLRCSPLWEQRRYTLTHSDLTGQLQLSIGCEFNRAQLSGWYIQLIRDEVLAEWIVGSSGEPELHLFCHISGEERWPAPAALRNYIFRREMPLVLDTIRYGDREFLQQTPQLLDAAVFVHLSSHVQAFNEVVRWGTFGDQTTWKQPALLWFQTWWRSLTVDRGRYGESQLEKAVLKPQLEPEAVFREQTANASAMNGMLQGEQAAQGAGGEIIVPSTASAANGRVNGAKIPSTTPSRAQLEQRDAAGRSANGSMNGDAELPLSASTAVLLEAAESALRASQSQEDAHEPQRSASGSANGLANVAANGSATERVQGQPTEGREREKQQAGASRTSSSAVLDSKGEPLCWGSVASRGPAFGVSTVRERQ